MIKLLPFQEIGRDFLALRNNAILADDMGLGKTYQALEAIKKLRLTSGLIITPQSIRRSWVKRIREQIPLAFIKEISSPKLVPEISAFNVVNYDIVWKEPLITLLQEQQWPVLVCDECFTGDTLVDTPTGPKQIKDIQVGDKVVNVLGVSEVEHITQKTFDSSLEICYNQHKVRCSKNHLWFTTKGWVPANGLREGDELITTETAYQIMRGMWERVFCGSRIVQSICSTSSVLRIALFNDLEVKTARNQSFNGLENSTRSHKSGAKEILETCVKSKEKRSRKNPSQFIKRTRRQTTGQNLRFVKNDRLGADNKRGKWPWPHKSRAFFASGVGEDVDLELRSANEILPKGKIPNPLQVRFSVTWAFIRRGSRRVYAWFSKKTRQPSRPVFKTFRVDSIKVHKCAGDDISGSGIKDNIFYDLTIKGHPSYSVNGVLVHNSHYLKNIEAKRTKIILGKKGLYNKCQRRWLMTGTPVLNRPVELYPALRSLFPDFLGKYTNFYDYAYKFCAGYQGPFGFDCTGASNLDQLSQILRPIMLRRLKSGVQKELPFVSYEKIYLDPTDKLVSLTEQERQEFNLKKLISETSSIRRLIGTIKVAAAIKHLNDILEEKDKIVVFIWHKDVAMLLHDAFKTQSVLYTGAESASQKEKALLRFQKDPEIKLFIGNLQSAGFGVDGLQHVCDCCVFVEMSYVPNEIKQAVDRLNRMGQTKSVLAQFLIAENSVDEDVIDSLTEKAKNINVLMGERGKTEFVETRCQMCRQIIEMKNLKRIAKLTVCENCRKNMECMI